MAHFVYPAGTPLGTVPFGYVVPSTEWQTTIQQLFKAVNGDEGGTWAPSGFITIGGSGLELAGMAHSIAASARLNVESSGEIRLKNGALLRADGTNGDIRLEVLSNVATLTVELAALLKVNGGGTLTADALSEVNLNGGTYVRGTTTFMSTANGGPGTLVFEGNNTLTAASSCTATWNGPWLFGGTLTVYGVLTVSSSSAFTSALSVGTNLTVGGNVATTGNETVGGNLAVTGTTTTTGTVTTNGALVANSTATFNDVVARVGDDAYDSLRSADGPDSNSTIDAWNEDVWTATLTANRAWTLAAGPSGKAFRVIFVAPAANTLTISGAGVSVTLSRTALSGDYKIVELVWARTEWLILGGETV